jgi:dTDP-4-amino-4,6-dideoxygalactose transaminase
VKIGIFYRNLPIKVIFLAHKSKFGLNRDELANKLKEQGVFARKYFYPLVSENKEFKNDMTVNTPNALEISRNILCLPLYAHLDVADVDRICEIILENNSEVVI